MSSFFDSASLVQIPSGYSDGTLYSVKPIDGSGDLTFSRGSDIEATRVNANGYIQKAAVNLLLQSNSFSTTWSNTRSTESSGYAGYDGTNDAWKLEEDSNTGTHLIQQNVVSGAGVHTISCYFKSAERSGVQFLLEGSASHSHANFDLSTGAVQSSGESGSFTLIEAKITSVGGGWYRASVSASTGVATSWVKIYTLDAGFNTSYAGTTGEGIYIQDAQLNYGLVAQEYQETTTTSVVSGITNDMPRLDYSGGASCGSLKLEPSRTNILTQSEYFGGSEWTKTNATITSNAATSPEGVINASKIVENTANTNHFLLEAVANTSGVQHTISVFAKADGRDYLWIYAGGGPAQGSFYNLATGELGAVLGIAPNDRDIKPMGDGWYKCILTYTATDASSDLTIGPAINDTTNTYTGDGTSGVYLYGAQVEAGSYSTSYIPTYGTSATRTKDACSKTGISSLIGQTEGTIFLDFVYNGVQNLYGNLINSERNITNSFYIHFGLDGNIRAGVFANSVQRELTASGFVIGQRYKLAFAYKTGELAIYSNGVQKATSANTFTFNSSLDDIFLNDTTTYFGYQENVSFNQALLFKTRLSNADLATLTTL